MPNVYEIEVNGQLYEVEAPDEASAVAAARGQAYTAQRRADVAPQQAHQRSLPAKLGTGLSDAPMRAWESFAQLGTTIAELVGAKPPGSVEEQTSKMNTRRLLKTGGDEATEDAADIGELALLATPVGKGIAAAKGASTVGQLLLRGAVQPAVEAAALMPASETAKAPGDVLGERALGAATGGTIGGTVATVAAVRPAVRNYISRLKQAATKSQSLLDARRKAGNFLEGQTLTVSQQTGNEVAKGLESQVRATVAQNFFVKQMETFAERWDLMVRDFARHGGITSRGDVSYLGTAKRLSDAWKASEASAQSAASRLYGAKLNQVLDLASKDQSKFPVPFTKLAAATDEIAAGSGGGDWWRAIYPGAERPSYFITKLDGYIKALKGEPGFTQGLDIAELVNMRRALNQMDQDFYQAIRSNPNVASDMLARHATLRKVIRGIDEDIKTFTQSVPPDRPARQALERYAEANDEYATFADNRDFMRQTATGQLFGGEIPADPQKFLTQIARMEPAQQTTVVNILRQQDPEALHHLRVGLVQNALDKGRLAMETAEASHGPLDITKVGKAMLGENEVLGSRIFSPAQYAEIKKGLAAIRVLEEAGQGGVSVNRTPGIESGAMAGVSMSSAFLARMAYRLAGAAWVEKALFTKQGLAALDTMSDLYAGKGVTANKVARATAYLASAAGVAGEMDEELAAWVEANK